MVSNNLIIKLKKRTVGEIEKAKEMLLSMEGKIPMMRFIRVEVDIRGPQKAPNDILLITRFDTREDMDAYLHHPVHLAVASYIKSVMESGSSLCFESSGTPTDFNPPSGSGPF